MLLIKKRWHNVPPLFCNQLFTLTPGLISTPVLPHPNYPYSPAASDSQISASSFIVAWFGYDGE